MQSIFIYSRGATSSSFRGGGHFSWTFIRWRHRAYSTMVQLAFSQTVTYNNNVFLPADTRSIVQTHTFYTTLINKNRQNRTFNVLQQRWRLNHRC